MLEICKRYGLLCFYILGNFNLLQVMEIVIGADGDKLVSTIAHDNDISIILVLFVTIFLLFNVEHLKT